MLGRVVNNTSVLGLMPVLVSRRRADAPLSTPDQLSYVYLRRFGLALLLFSPYLYQYCRYVRVSSYKEDFARTIQKLCTLSLFKRLSSYAQSHRATTSSSLVSDGWAVKDQRNVLAR